MMAEIVAFAGLVVAGDKLERPPEHKLILAAFTALVILWIRQCNTTNGGTNGAKAPCVAKASPGAEATVQQEKNMQAKSVEKETQKVQEEASRSAAEAARLAADREANLAWHAKRQRMLQEAKAAEVRVAAERAEEQSATADQTSEKQTPENQTPNKQTPDAEKHSPRSLGDKISSLGDSARRKLSIRKTQHQVAPAAADAPAPEESSPPRRPSIRDSDRASDPERRASESF